RRCTPAETECRLPRRRCRRGGTPCGRHPRSCGRARRWHRSACRSRTRRLRPGRRAAPGGFLRRASAPSPATRTVSYRLLRAQRDQGNWCSSTRRFCARPAAVVLVAIGFAAPYTFATIRPGATPLLPRYARTASARACDSLRLVASDPAWSVEPAVSLRLSGLAFRDCAP